MFTIRLVPKIIVLGILTGILAGCAGSGDDETESGAGAVTVDTAGANDAQGGAALTDAWVFYDVPHDQVLEVISDFRELDGMEARELSATECDTHADAHLQMRGTCVVAARHLPAMISAIVLVPARDVQQTAHDFRELDGMQTMTSDGHNFHCDRVEGSPLPGGTCVLAFK